MVAPVPAQLSKLPSRLPAAAPRRRFTTHCPPLTTHFQRMLTPFLLITYIQTKYFHALTHSFAQRRAAIPCPSKSLRTLSIATGVYLESVPDDILSHPQRRQLFCLHRLATSLPSLFTILGVRSLCFQSVAASFPKIPGVWVSRTVLRDDPGWGGATSDLSQPHASIFQPRASTTVILSATPVPRAYCAMYFSPPPLPGRTEPRFRALPVS